MGIAAAQSGHGKFAAAQLLHAGRLGSRKDMRVAPFIKIGDVFDRCAGQPRINQSRPRSVDNVAFTADQSGSGDSAAADAHHGRVESVLRIKSEKFREYGDRMPRARPAEDANELLRAKRVLQL